MRSGLWRGTSWIAARAFFASVRFRAFGTWVPASGAPAEFTA
jgi:hypothetical protein